MSSNKFYYSAGEKEEKIKIVKLVLSIILVALLVFTCVYTIIYVRSLEKEHTIQTETASSQFLDVNVLICVEDKENKDVKPQFLLAGFDGEAKVITFCEIPDSLQLNVQDKSGTALKLFEYGSARYLRDAIQNHFGITVRRFISCSLSEVEVFVDKLGGLDYEVEEQMQYENSEGSLVTNLVKGKQKLNGNQYCQYIRYDNWDSDSQKREKREALCVALLNEYAKTLDCDSIISIYKSVSNNLETDASIVEVNDFGLKFGDFSEVEAPAVSAQVDFSDEADAKAQIQKIYK